MLPFSATARFKSDPASMYALTTSKSPSTTASTRLYAGFFSNESSDLFSRLIEVASSLSEVVVSPRSAAELSGSPQLTWKTQKANNIIIFSWISLFIGSIE